ncbi:MAG: VIT1/CCC1 transporter family protein [Candidatus Omnitrophica bacterium]|nr:VIT1/CCC1 transporter family protein [Candidatus Omnitrophota bacterium]
MNKTINPKVLAAQVNELTEAVIYKELANIVKLPAHREILLRIAREEEAHALVLKGITGQEVTADQGRVFWYVSISRIFGLNFGLRLMENQEDLAQGVYEALKTEHPGVEQLYADEQSHEKTLLDMIDEERLKYIGAVVLGLNDALVELVGVLAGLTLALQNMKLIVVAGLITGIAASLSMAVAAYLACRQDDDGKDPLKSALYTGVAYILTVVFLIWPYLVLSNMYAALAIAIVDSILIIWGATFYIAVAKNVSFWKRFAEMTILSVIVAALNFGVGLMVHQVFGINV